LLPFSVGVLVGNSEVSQHTFGAGDEEGKNPMSGTWDKTKGVIKEKVGKATGDRRTEVSGKLDQVKGKLETKVGKAKGALRRETDR
jgi:uncharacterized protein YjbJ (UPF0337 family)